MSIIFRRRPWRPERRSTLLPTAPRHSLAMRRESTGQYVATCRPCVWQGSSFDQEEFAAIVAEHVATPKPSRV